MTISRRTFVRSSGLALITIGLGRGSRWAVSDRPVLVCVVLRGAIDGLSVIVPHQEPAYYRDRPRTAIPAKDVIDLDGQFGLHPSLAPLKPFWDNKILAAIPAIGVPDVLRSHPEAQDRLNTWLTRLDAVPFASLPDIARAIKTGVAPAVVVTHLDGWDTHFNQGASDGRLAARFRELGLGLAAFSRDLGERMRSVVVLTMSEFGRTIAENGNGGTDHGHATAMLVMGGPVNGGKVLGRWPGLDPASRFEGRDVAVTTDFRDLFGEILARHLGAGDLAAVFPGFTPNPQRFPGTIQERG